MSLKQLTPNLMVEDIDKTIHFYREVLGFGLVTTVPAQAPYNFAMLNHGEVMLMFQSRQSLGKEYPDLGQQPVSGSMTFYVEVDDVQHYYDHLKNKVELVQDLHTAFYGMKEFGFRDCNGYILVYGERV